MTRYSVSFAMGLALLVAGGMSAGCGKKKGEKESPAAAAEPPNKAQGSNEAAAENPTLAQMRDARDQICKCSDIACVEGVMQKFKHLDQAAQTLSKDEKKTALSIGMKLAACIDKIAGPVGVKAPSGPPADAGAGAAAPAATPAATKEEQAILDEMTQVQIAVCKCKDSACAQAVMDKHKKLDAAADKLSPAGQDRAMKIAMELATCMAKMQHEPH